jgi:hypothetical protein
LVLRIAIGVAVVLVLVLIAEVGGAFRSSGKPAAKSPGAGAPTTTAAPPTTASPSTTTTAAAPTTPTTAATTSDTAVAATPVHSVTATTAPWRIAVSLSRTVALPVSDGIDLLGGLLDGGHSSNLVRHLALPSGTITADGHLAVAVHSAAGVTFGGKQYLYAGATTGEVAGIQQIVPGSTATSAGSLPSARADLVAVTVGTKVVLLGGFDGTKALADVLVSTDGVHFTVLTKLPVPVRYAAAVVRGDQIYLYGGDVAGKQTDDIQRIDVTAGTATVVGHLPEPIGHEAALVFGGTVWLAGGTTPTGTSARLYRSDDGVSFVKAGALPAPRSDAGVAMVGGVGYLIGGESAARFNTIVVVTPG